MSELSGWEIALARDQPKTMDCCTERFIQNLKESFGRKFVKFRLHPS